MGLEPWSLNGVPLGDATVAISALSGSSSTRTAVRQSVDARLGLSDSSQRVGRDLPRKSITFTFRGSKSAAKATSFESVWAQVRDAQAFTLEAPSGQTVFKTFRRAAFQARRLSHPAAPGQGLVRMDLRLEATVLGAWIADGGDYCHDHILGQDGASGFFTKNGDGTWSHNGTANTGTIPTIELPDQTSGYPLGVTSTFQEATIPSTDSRTIVGADGSNITVRTYDLTGFLIPTPTATGDRGLFRVCSSPTSDFLDHEDGTYLIASTGAEGIVTGGGIASAPIASLPIGAM